MQDAFSLLAYSDPWNSPVGYQLDALQREPVCSTLNSAILGRSAATEPAPAPETVPAAPEPAAAPAHKQTNMSIVSLRPSTRSWKAQNPAGFSVLPSPAALTGFPLYPVGQKTRLDCGPGRTGLMVPEPVKRIKMKHGSGSDNKQSQESSFFYSVRPGTKP